MELTLKDYQADAVAAMLQNLADARDDFHRKKRNVSFSLSATTGAGKTVMAAAVIEALFFGNDDYDFEADPGAVVLWFTSDPSLNEQTRFRIIEAAGDSIASSRLKVIDSSFNQEKLEPGNVYFLNSQKLSKTSLLVRGADDRLETLIERTASPDLRAFTFWDTLKNTIEDDRLTLYLVLDEAHQGMKRQTSADRDDRQTIVKRLVNGANGVPPVPIVWGISATIQRFTDAMREAEAQGRTTYASYEVDPARIQESGLLKDDIRLDFPTETGEFETVLLARAVRKIRRSSAAWADYVAAQDPPVDPVIPLLVVQVPNKPRQEDLLAALGTIRTEWPELPADAIANVFGEHIDLEIGDITVPYVAPERVQDDTRVRVLLAKDAISTGWDCPRAEVLVSFRPASDETHITQLLGRMVRTPLARRVTGNDELNSVECLLPHFNRDAATAVAEVLLGRRGEGERGGSGGGNGRRVLYKPVDTTPNRHLPDVVWAAFDIVPSETLPQKAAKPTRRVTALAQALSYDKIVPDARKAAYKELFALLDSLLVRFEDEIDAATKGILSVEGETIAAKVGEGVSTLGTFTEDADSRSLHADYKAAQRIFSSDIAAKYVEHLAPGDDDDALVEAELKVAALALVPEAVHELDRVAKELAERWLTKYRVDIKGVSEERQQVYKAIIAMSDEPEPVGIVRPKIRSEETEEASGALVDVRPGHLMSDPDGTFPIGSLNSWETDVLDAERGRADFLAWYRNPSRGSDDSLAIAYQKPTGAWHRMCPDFMFFHGTENDVKISIVDPHGDHLGDSLPKLRGLARYVEEHGSTFHRVESVAKVGGKLRLLDIKEAAVRQAIRDAADVETLYRSAAATDYDS